MTNNTLEAVRNTAMRSFLPPEIYLQIFNLLDTADLTSAACVCPAWSEPAINVKWTSRCVPLKALLNVCGQVTDEEGGVMSIPIPTNDSNAWQRLTKYANMVRELRLAKALDSTSLRQLRDRLRVSELAHLCPNILSLDARAESDLVETYQAVVGPLLSSFDIRQKTTIEAYTALIEAVSRRSPPLEKLVIGGISDFNEAILEGFQTLRKLVLIGFVAPRMWHTLATRNPNLETLKVIKLIDGAEDDDFDALEDWTFPSLPALRSLDLSGTCDPVFETEFLQGTVMPSLVKAQLSITYYEDEEAIEVVNALALGSPQLEDLCIEISAMNAADQETDLPYAGFLPFHNLKRLYIDGPNLGIRTPDDARAFAAALPNLVSLELWTNTSDENVHPFGWSIPMLQIILQGCAGLRRLGIDINVCDYHPASSLPTDTIHQDLEELKLHIHLILSDVKPFAQWVSQLFPRADSFFTSVELYTVNADGEPESLYEGTDDYLEQYSRENIRFHCMIEAYQKEGLDADEKANQLFNKKWAVAEETRAGRSFVDQAREAIHEVMALYNPKHLPPNGGYAGGDDGEDESGRESDVDEE